MRNMKENKLLVILIIIFILVTGWITLITIKMTNIIQNYEIQINEPIEKNDTYNTIINY